MLFDLGCLPLPRGHPHNSAHSSKRALHSAATVWKSAGVEILTCMLTLLLTKEFRPHGLNTVMGHWVLLGSACPIHASMDHSPGLLPSTFTTRATSFIQQTQHDALFET